MLNKMFFTIRNNFRPLSLSLQLPLPSYLHNYKRFLDLELAVGDLVIIRKAGDIIPEIISKITNLEND